MKSKEQKIREAVDRAKQRYQDRPFKRHEGWTLEEYLDLFLPKHLKGSIQPVNESTQGESL